VLELAPDETALLREKRIDELMALLKGRKDDEAVLAARELAALEARAQERERRHIWSRVDPLVDLSEPVRACAWLGLGLLESDFVGCRVTSKRLCNQTDRKTPINQSMDV
jgi:hypothetical protein